MSLLRLRCKVTDEFEKLGVPNVIGGSLLGEGLREASCQGSTEPAWQTGCLCLYELLKQVLKFGKLIGYAFKILHRQGDGDPWQV